MFEKNSILRYKIVLPKRVHQCCLVKSPFAFLGDTRETTLLCSLGEAGILLDFDEEIVGGLEVTLTCTAGMKVRIDYEEYPDYALRKEPLTCSWYELVTDEYDLTPGTHTVVSKGRRGFRFVHITVQSAKNVRLDMVQAMNGGWPVEFRGAFRCSDEQLNRIWDISAATVRACMQAFYEDGVKRDGLLWLGDYRVTFLSAWYLFGDADLARKSLLMMRDSQYDCGAIPACAARGGGEQHHQDNGIAYMPTVPGDGQDRWIIPNYMCDYIRSIDEYVRLTGDDTILPEMKDSARRAAEFLVNMADFETPGQWRIDPYASERDEYGFNYTILMDGNINPKTNVSSKGALLMEMLGALQSLEYIAERSGDILTEQWAKEQQERLDDHIETNYRDEQHGEYKDEFGQAFGDIMQYMAPRAVLAGKKDPVGIQRMMRSVMPNLGFSMAWRIEALFKEGYAHEALRDICSAWGKMLEADSRTCWERLDVPEMNETHYYDAPGSYCHGWSASPAWQLPAWVTGVHAEDAGFSSVTIMPNLDTLDWAEATVPTLEGEIFVRAEKEKGELNLTLDIPQGVEVCTIKWQDGTEQGLTGPGQFVLSSRG